MSILKDLDFDQDDIDTATEHMNEASEDFTINDYRFIKDDHLHAALVDYLESDEYCLGCFAPWFIAQCTDWPVVLIEAAQEGEAYEALGKALISGDMVDAMATGAASIDGYAHFFNSYDGSVVELNGYSIFRN